jgi:YVTN family beta-propeller protein
MLETDMKLTIFACAAFLSFAVSAVASETTTPVYKLVASIPLGGGERWDYVTFDPSRQRVYVAHGDHVTVVDAASRTVIGQIGTFPGGTHGIGIVPGLNRGYTDDGKAGTVAAFDTETLKVANTLAAAPDADGIVYDAPSGHIFVVNGDSGSLTVVDPNADKPVATIAIGAGLEAAISDGNGHLYVDGAENHDMIEIDTRSNAVMAHWPMPGCVQPHGIAIDPVARRVFSTCANKQMVVLDADSGKIVAMVPIGAYSDGAAFDPVRKLAISPNGDGTLSVIAERDPDHFESVGTVPTTPSARTIAIDPGRGLLYLPAADIAKLDLPTTPGGRPHVTYVTNSLKLLVFAPAN